MSKVQLAVGQVWKDRVGREITVADNPKYPDESDYPFKDADGPLTFLSNGRWCKVYVDSDLIELVQDENGWRPWKATADSQCPVSEDTLVFARLGTGSTNDEPDAAGSLIWSSMSSASIVAYKIAEETPKPVEPVHAEAHSAQHREAQEAPAIRLLQVAADHMRARAATYDKPDGERSMGKTVAAFNAVTGRDLSEAEGWLLLQLLKDVRLFQRPGYHADSAEDCIAYAALKAEAKMAEGE